MTSNISVRDFVFEYPIITIDANSLQHIDSRMEEALKPKQTAPKAYQRYVVWKLLNKRLYIDSILEGMAVSPIIIVDVKSCLDFAKTTKNKTDINLFQRFIDEDILYLSLDGQNRSQAICEFLCNKFQITGEFSINNKKVHIGNKYFKDINPEYQRWILDRVLSICVVRKKTLIQLKDMFVRLNSGCGLEPQEIRNAMNTPVASFSREVATKLSSLCEKILTEEDLLRMGDRRLMSKVFLLMDSGDNQQDLYDSDLDSFYKKGEGTSCLSEAYNACILRGDLLNILGTINKSTGIRLKKLKSRVFWTMIQAIQHYDGKAVVSDPILFRKDTEDHIDALVTASIKQLGVDILHWENAGKNPATSPKAGDYFHNQIKNTHMGQVRSRAFEHFIKHFRSDGLTKVIIESAAK